MENRADLGKFLKEKRLEKNLSKFQASRQLGYKSDGTLNCIEQGRGPIPVEKIHPIADIYEMDVKDLLNMIKKCDPDLFKKYVILTKSIIKYHDSQRLKAVFGDDFALHHRPYFFPGKEAMSDNVTYVNPQIRPRFLDSQGIKGFDNLLDLYIMSTKNKEEFSKEKHFSLKFVPRQADKA